MVISMGSIVVQMSFHHIQEVGEGPYKIITGINDIV
jgi:hypothetical protein